MMSGGAGGVDLEEMALGPWALVASVFFCPIETKTLPTSVISTAGVIGM
eukprot:CAMPEP_0172915806 /NCGR_PEP_ID=MMETSP1075-20121228/195000_1 /TAXON_ID=2916 /ORGANISM="Ceratium fusus, Strain PA161109" /LENGTH=48 /DNA_ID= /DNA_START= /DNA_END= /DNA_ORIENTATION=